MNVCQVSYRERVTSRTNRPMSIRPPSPLLPSAFNALRKHLPQRRIVLVLLNVVYANMPIIH